MAGRKIRDEVDARACMAAARAARGMTQTQWARKNGVDGRSLFAWSRNLARGDRTRGGKRRRGAAGMVELVPAAITEGPSSRYVIRFGDVSIETDGHFDDKTLARLVGVLKGC